MQANRQQACSIFGLTRREFDQLVVVGFPAKKKSGSRGEDWSIDTVEAFRWLVVQELAKHGVGGDADRPADVSEERARLLRAQANLAEIELARQRGRLVDAEEVRVLITRMVGAANARLGAVPVKWAPIVNPADPVEARRLLELAVEEVRSELRRLDVDEARDAAA
jgi:phage terminase Nu1 subunit (DNA packaging protein)